jgi:hypothetical protein
MFQINSLDLVLENLGNILDVRVEVWDDGPCIKVMKDIFDELKAFFANNVFLYYLFVFISLNRLVLDCEMSETDGTLKFFSEG